MKLQRNFCTAIPVFLIFLTGQVLGQHPNHAKFPHTSIQQSWVDPNQLAVIEIMAKFDFVQAPLTDTQIMSLRAKNPNIIILPFDSLKERANWGLPEEWLADPADNGSSVRAWWDVGDNCIRVDGQTYREYKAKEVLDKWRNRPYDGIYLDHWDLPYFGSLPRLTKDEYKDGMTDFGQLLKDALPGKIVIGNGANALDFSYNINGFMLEDFPGPIANIDETVGIIEDWERRAAKPLMIIVNQRSRGEHVVEDKSEPDRIIANFWERARYAITFSMLKNSTYVMFNMGSGGLAHWASSWWFDEYDVDIGTPVGESYKLSNGVSAREFTNGIVLCNTTASPQTVTASQLSGKYYRFRGGQQPQFNNGSEFTEITLDGWPYRGKTPQPVGDGIILVKSPQTIVSDIIIDDEGFNPRDFMGEQSANFNSEFVQTGMLFDGEGYRRWTDAWYIHGHNSCYYANPGTGSAQWIPKIGFAGNYEVFEWHPAANDHASNVSLEIRHSNGITKKEVNQKINGGRWNSLGTYGFSEGTSGYVKITGDNANGIVIADAVKFVYKDSNSTVDNSSPDPPKGVKVENL